MNLNSFQQYHPQLTQTHCPKCKKDISAIVMAEYDFHTELFHNAPSCMQVWTYSSYEQCKLLQQKRQERLIMDFKDQYYGGQRATNRVIIGGQIAIGSTLVVSTLGAAAVVGVVGAWLFNRFYKKTEIEDLTDKSYFLEDMFKKEKYPYHVFSVDYLTEAAPFTERHKAAKISREEISQRQFAQIWA